MTKDDSDLARNAARLYTQSRFEEAFGQYKLLAEKGYAEPQYFLGWLYYGGYGVARNESEAYKWFERAAIQGLDVAEFYCGRVLAFQNRYSDAFTWFSKSASKGYSPSLYWLGLIYSRGLGVERDKDRAYEYYRQASEKGHIWAKREIARFHLKGRRGFIGVFKGAIIFISAAAEALRVGLRDRCSVRLKY